MGKRRRGSIFLTFTQGVCGYRRPEYTFGFSSVLVIPPTVTPTLPLLSAIVLSSQDFLASHIEEYKSKGTCKLRAALRWTHIACSIERRAALRNLDAKCRRGNNVYEGEGGHSSSDTFLLLTV